jgi:vacuolar protein sorting-associated protein 13A/C
MIIHKLVSLKNFSVYWNPERDFLSFKNSAEMGKFMSEMIFREKQTQLPEHCYIMKPISGSLQVRLNKNEIPDMKIPYYHLNFLFDEIAITLEEGQYKNFLQMLESFSFYHKGVRYQKFRPKKSVKGDPAAWWKFASA